jgi:tetrapyrrole methylase family protein/MazG family protein
LKKSRSICPWTKTMTLEFMSKEILSEAKEVEEAVQNKDFEHLKEEIGDVLMDCLTLAIIAEEHGYFTIKEAFEEVTKKIKRRKPWVFGDAKVENIEEAIAMWNEIKRKEKENK